MISAQHPQSLLSSCLELKYCHLTQIQTNTIDQAELSCCPLTQRQNQQQHSRLDRQAAAAELDRAVPLSV